MTPPRRSLLPALGFALAIFPAHAQTPQKPNTDTPAPHSPALPPSSAPAPTAPTPPSPAPTPTSTSTPPAAQEPPIAPTQPDAPAPAPTAKPTPSPAPPASDKAAADLGALFYFGKQLFDEYAPDQIKENFEFPTAEQWLDFTSRLQKSLEAGSLEELAALEPEARRTLAALRLMPEYEDYGDWLAERLDLMETARVATASIPDPRPSSAPASPPSSAPDAPAPPPATPSPDSPYLSPSPDSPPPAIVTTPPAPPPVPYYALWHDRIRNRRKPARADELMPLLKVIFVSEGLPPELVWLAEVESSLNPNARSPAGAHGLFQLMPATARSLGLSTFPFDERSQPGKNARAAARLLRLLHNRFDSWPLVLAAYNAGEGRVANTLKRKSATTFQEIAEDLPAETRMYVPKVLATVSIRENISIDHISRPGSPQVLRRPEPLPPAIIAATP